MTEHEKWQWQEPGRAWKGVGLYHITLTIPDHLHAVLYVRRTMPTGIKGMVRGFWQGVKKLGRASSIIPNDIRRNCQEGTLGLQEATRNLEVFAEGLKGQMSDRGLQKSSRGSDRHLEYTPD